MVEFLYNLFIMPIELLVEITYGAMYRLLDNCGLAIIAVSLVVQTLILPLYKRSDAIQDEERQRQKNMSYWVKHIKRTFKGDEQFMMLSTYYRQQGYKSWYALKSSFSILLQIPFFIAAYHYLSGLSALNGQAFLFISDLSKPDSIFNAGIFSINVLPLLMTAFNIISGIIYTKDLGKRDKIQVYGLAVVFLVLLYNSPAGLVLYWTMNNFYSLMKNICLKLLAGRIKLPPLKMTRLKKVTDHVYEKHCISGIRLYAYEAVFLTAFIGGVVALNVVSASPAEFMSYSYGPLELVLSNVSVYAGIFLVWGMILASFMKPKAQYIFSVVMFIISGVAILDYMGFGNNFGRMSALLVYDETPVFQIKDKLLNSALICLLVLVLAAVSIKCAAAVKRIMQILALGVCIMCVVNTFSVNAKVNAIKELNEKNSSEDEKLLHLSKNGKNVIVIMLDRAINGYIPFLFDEKPELKEAFAGFTYYPNTLSYGGCTNLGAPALFGGYEYTPEEMNKRADESIADKHNEALLVMPKLFSDEGYKVTVCDPPYAGNYDWTPDLSLYDDYENVEAYITEGKYTDEYYAQFAPTYQVKQKRQFIYHSLMKVAPVIMQPRIYSGGGYWSNADIPISSNFIDSYSVLVRLPRLTEISDDSQNNCILFQNNTTHSISLLKVPEYVPAENVSVAFDNEEGYDGADVREVNGHTLVIENKFQAAHYQSNMAAMLALSDWFDYMRKNGCWDNTRIIIVADHGHELANFDYMVFDESLDIERYNPLLMVKDFNATEFTESDELMTNADVPSIAVEGLIETPINPFTGKEINSDAKREPIRITTSINWDTNSNNGNVFDTSDAPWYEITGDNIFDKSNWKKIE